MESCVSHEQLCVKLAVAYGSGLKFLTYELVLDYETDETFINQQWNNVLLPYS